MDEWSRLKSLRKKYFSCTGKRLQRELLINGCVQRKMAIKDPFTRLRYTSNAELVFSILDVEILQNPAVLNTISSFTDLEKFFLEKSKECIINRKHYQSNRGWIPRYLKTMSLTRIRQVRRDQEAFEECVQFMQSLFKQGDVQAILTPFLSLKTEDISLS